MKTSVAIVGHGVVGLACCQELARSGYRCTVYYEACGCPTTSWNAGAFWYPFLVAKNPDVLTYALDSYEEFQSLFNKGFPGIRSLGIEVFLESDQSPPQWKSSVKQFEWISARELPSGSQSGYRFDSFSIDMPVYLEAIKEDCMSMGVKFIKKHLENFSELDEPVVINCTGNGAKLLCNDESITPVHGEIIVFEGANAVDKILFYPEAKPHPRYLIPHENHFIIGGSCVAPHESKPSTEEIISFASKSFGPLDSKLVRETRSGYRPTRNCLRLGVQSDFHDKVLVHNYGHGGAGVTLSIGCAKRVACILANHSEKL